MGTILHRGFLSVYFQSLIAIYSCLVVASRGRPASPRRQDGRNHVLFTTVILAIRMLPAICWMNHAVCYFLSVVCEEQIWVRMHDTCTGMGAQDAPPMHLQKRHPVVGQPTSGPPQCTCVCLSFGMLPNFPRPVQVLGSSQALIKSHFLHQKGLRLLGQKGL